MIRRLDEVGRKALNEPPSWSHEQESIKENERKSSHSHHRYPMELQKGDRVRLFNDLSGM